MNFLMIYNQGFCFNYSIYGFLVSFSLINIMIDQDLVHNLGFNYLLNC